MNDLGKSIVTIIDNFSSVFTDKWEYKQDMRISVLQCLYIYLGISQVFDQSEEDDLPMGIFEDSFSDLTANEEILMAASFMVNAYKNLLEGHWPFNYFCAEEWAWASLLSSSLELIPKTANPDNDPWIAAYNYIFEKSITSDEFYNNEFISSFDLEDGFCLCRSFYASAWTDKTKQYLNQRNGEIIPLCDKIWKSPADMIYNLGYLNDELKPTNSTFAKVISHKEIEIVKSKTTKSKTQQSKYLYLMKCERNGFYKIGVSIDPSFREKTLSSEDPSVKLVAKWEGLSHKEKDWHEYYKNERVRGEWFNLTPAQVRYICSTNQPNKNLQITIQ